METIFKILCVKSINFVDSSFLNINGKVFSRKEVILVNMKQKLGLHKILPVVTSNLVLFY